MARLADKAKVGHALGPGLRIACAPLQRCRLDEAAVLAAEADCGAALRVDRGHDLLVDGAGEHHLDDFDGRCIGDAQAVDEIALDAEAAEHPGDLRAAAMDHHRVDADLLEQDHVAREVLGERGIAHGVAAVLDHHAPTGEAPHIRQRLGDRGCGAQPMFGVADALHGVPGRSQAPAHPGATAGRGSLAYSLRRSQRGEVTPERCDPRPGTRAGSDQRRIGSNVRGKRRLDGGGLRRQRLRRELVALGQHREEGHRALVECGHDGLIG